MNVLRISLFFCFCEGERQAQVALARPILGPLLHRWIQIVCSEISASQFYKYVPIVSWNQPALHSSPHLNEVIYRAASKLPFIYSKNVTVVIQLWQQKLEYCNKISRPTYKKYILLQHLKKPMLQNVGKQQFFATNRFTTKITNKFNKKNKLLQQKLCACSN